jgi:hypothetical protein
LASPAGPSANTPAAPGQAAITATPRRQQLAAAPDNPRAQCGSRTNFSLLYCMQSVCKQDRFYAHSVCKDVRLRGEVSG